MGVWVGGAYGDEGDGSELVEQLDNDARRLAFAQLLVEQHDDAVLPLEAQRRELLGGRGLVHLLRVKVRVRVRVRLRGQG